MDRKEIIEDLANIRDEMKALQTPKFMWDHGMLSSGIQGCILLFDSAIKELSDARINAAKLYKTMLELGEMFNLTLPYAKSYAEIVDDWRCRTGTVRMAIADGDYRN